MKRRQALRLPTEPERRWLADSWSAVTNAAGVDPGDYSLWVQKSPGINAYAAAGHTVAVTEAALQNLSPGQLEAVLAHELGHHLGGHAWASLLRYWYSLPATYVFQFATYLSLALSTALQSDSIAVVTTISLLVVGFLGYLVVTIPVLGISAAVLVVFPFGLMWVQRVQEFEADAIAAQIGYGHALAHLLMVTTPTAEKGRPGRRHRIGKSHPSHAQRVDRLEAMANPAGSPAE